jgi:oligopeptide/dipeptide ABC transporter ATP-binding protein
LLSAVRESGLSRKRVVALERGGRLCHVSLEATREPDSGNHAAVREEILRVEELRTYFFSRSGIVKAVDGVSFTVRKGEGVALVGESGCGKSMTCLSIMGLMPTPAARIVGGKVSFLGRNLLEASNEEMRRTRGRHVAMIMQDPQTSLNPLYNVGDQVGEPVRYHTKERGKALVAKVINAMNMVRIPTPEERVNQYPHQFSGGMRQRVVAAMGLITGPELLIADEPTTSLDVTIQAQFLTLIKELQEQSHSAVLWVTHNLGIVAQMCDRVHVMYAGGIVESGSVQRIFADPKHPYTRGLMDSLPRLGVKRERLHQIEGEPPDAGALGPGCPFYDRCTFRMDICKEQYPPTTRMDEEGYVRCWLFE